MPFLLIKHGELLVDIDYTHVQQYLIEMSILQVVDLVERHGGLVRLFVPQLGLLAKLVDFELQDLLVSLRISVGQLVYVDVLGRYIAQDELCLLILELPLLTQLRRHINSGLSPIVM